MRFAILAFFIGGSALGAEMSGAWEGKGNCYLDHGVSAQSACEVMVGTRLESDRLYLRTCAIWRQEWGNGHDCWEYQFEVRGKVLWLPHGDELIRVGRVSEDLIEIDYAFEGGFNREKYRWTDDGVALEREQQATGMRWLYRAELQPLK